MSKKVVAVVNSLCNAAQYRALIERVGLVLSATHEKRLPTSGRAGLSSVCFVYHTIAIITLTSPDTSNTTSLYPFLFYHFHPARFGLYFDSLLCTFFFSLVSINPFLSTPFSFSFSSYSSWPAWKRSMRSTTLKPKTQMRSHLQ